MKMRWKWMGLFAAVLLLSALPAVAVRAADYELKVGKRLDLGLEGAEYQSSDKSVVYIDQAGHVTAKKEGTARVTARENNIEATYVVKVKKDAKKPALKVAADEIRVVSAELSLEDVDETDGKCTYQLKVRLKNTSDQAVNSVAFVMRAGEQACNFYGHTLGAKKVKTFTEQLVTDEADPQLALVRLRVRAGGMYHTCNYETGNTSYEYATEDTTAPKITGFVGKNSYNESIPYQTVYADQADSYDFFKYVKAIDDRDGKVKLTADTSRVDFSRKGTYTITYTAVDSAGNKAKASAKIAVRTNDSYDKVADEVLRSIIRKDWSDQRKVTAIYNYAHGHIAYTGTSDKSSWEREAVRGIRNVRTEMNVAPGKKAAVYVVSENEGVRQIFEEGGQFFSALAAASELTVQADKGGIDDSAVSVVIPNATVYIPFEELVDIAQEIERLKKEQKRLEGELARVQGMLGNERFMSKAPKQKVDEERAKLEKYTQMKAQVEERLSQLM